MLSGFIPRLLWFVPPTSTVLVSPSIIVAVEVVVTVAVGEAVVELEKPMIVNVNKRATIATIATTAFAETVTPFVSLNR